MKKIISILVPLCFVFSSFASAEVIESTDIKIKLTQFLDAAKSLPEQAINYPYFSHICLATAGIATGSLLTAMAFLTQKYNKQENLMQTPSNSLMNPKSLEITLTNIATGLVHEGMYEDINTALRHVNFYSTSLEAIDAHCLLEQFIYQIP